jgi:hypothetical protein
MFALCGNRTRDLSRRVFPPLRQIGRQKEESWKRKINLTSASNKKIDSILLPFFASISKCNMSGLTMCCLSRSLIVFKTTSKKNCVVVSDKNLMPNNWNKMIIRLVQWTARQAKHLQFYLSANIFEIRAKQSLMYSLMCCWLYKVQTIYTTF